MKIQHGVLEDVIIYDVCDIDGKILINGELTSNEEETIIDLTSLGKGRFHLFLINEGNIFKKLISI